MFVAEYFLEDCIQMTNFVPPPMDRKKKDKDEEGGEDDVSHLFHDGPLPVSVFKINEGIKGIQNVLWLNCVLSRLCRLTVT